MATPETLREHGLRVTAPRLAVYEALGEHPHADAETVIRVARASLPTVSVQTVYDVLHALTACGLVRRIEPAGHPARYERRVADNHHHIVCRACGSLDDVDCAVGLAPCLEPSSTSGYLVESAEVTYWGLCPACRSAGEPTEL